MVKCLFNSPTKPIYYYELYYSVSLYTLIKYLKVNSTVCLIFYLVKPLKWSEPYKTLLKARTLATNKFKICMYKMGG